MRKFQHIVQNPVVIPSWCWLAVVALLTRYMFLSEGTFLYGVANVVSGVAVIAGVVAWVWRFKTKTRWSNVIMYSLAERPLDKRFPTEKTDYINLNDIEGTSHSFEIPR